MGCATRATGYQRTRGDGQACLKPLCIQSCNVDADIQCARECSICTQQTMNMTPVLRCACNHTMRMQVQNVRPFKARLCTRGLRSPIPVLRECERAGVVHPSLSVRQRGCGGEGVAPLARADVQRRRAGTHLHGARLRHVSPRHPHEWRRADSAGAAMSSGTVPPCHKGDRVRTNRVSPVASARDASRVIDI